jgi:hypothetical protein
MRRAFGIPDLVTDDNARAVILEEISDGVVIQAVGNQGPILEGIFDEIIKVGSQGQLDYLIVGGPPRPCLEPAGLYAAGRAIGLGALIRQSRGAPTSGSGWMGPTEDQITAVVTTVLDRFAGHVKAHPFEDDFK